MPKKKDSGICSCCEQEFPAYSLGYFGEDCVLCEDCLAEGISKLKKQLASKDKALSTLQWKRRWFFEQNEENTRLKKENTRLRRELKYEDGLKGTTQIGLTPKQYREEIKERDETIKELEARLICGFGGCKEPSVICQKHHNQFISDMANRKENEIQILYDQRNAAEDKCKELEARAANAEARIEKALNARCNSREDVCENCPRTKALKGGGLNGLLY